LFVYFLTICNCAVGIGTTNPDVTSILDIQSSNKGLLIPRMTKIERDNIITPALALQIYNTTDNTSIYLVAVFGNPLF
jgi:hypothetical protein